MSNKAEEGRQAYKNGLPRENNPYPQGTSEYWQWSSGWLDERAFRPRQVEAREWLIRKDGYFYRPNCQGYTTRKIEAGRYTKAKAEAEAAVEPWHMYAIHQDEIPDEPAIRDLNAIIASQAATIRQMREALKEIANSDDVDNALDPARNKRVARAALNGGANHG